MGLEMIGVELDQARHDQVAAGVLGTCWRPALADLGDAAVRKRQPALLDHPVGQHDPCIGDHDILRGVHFHVLQAAAAKLVTSTIRSAIR